MGVGFRIKAVLREQKMTIKQLSELANIPLNTLYSITKRDSERVDDIIINRIATTFALPESFFLALPPFDDLDSLSKYKTGVLEGLKHLCEKTHLDWYDPTDDISYWRLVGLLCSEIHFGPDGKKVYINMSPGAGVRLDRREHLSAKESELLDHFLLLNQQGQGKVIDYANDLLRNPDYQRFPDPPENKK